MRNELNRLSTKKIGRRC